MTPAPRVIVAGGGTGGHLYPGLALAETLEGRGLGVVFIGTAGGIEARAVPAAGYRLRLITGRQLRGGGVGRAAAGLAALGRGTAQAFGLLGELRPDLVVGVGGYASVAAVLAARLRRLPTVLLEQNVVPGAATRLLARFADRVCVGFAESLAALPRGRGVHTGNPVRAAVLRAADRPPHPRLGLLVFGGSAGARRVNEAILAALPHLGPLGRAIDVIHQTGAADLAAVRERYAGLGLGARVEPFLDDMGAAYAAADVVLARAGATSCAELTAVGLPSVLVPYPYAADDHQRRNAEVLAAAGAAEVIADRDLEGERLAAALRRLLEDGARRAAMAAAARALGRPDAAARVADECLALCARGRRKESAETASPS
jgi:UDP-N-acetylglucosamine--N-acetylmuramyl-(pentapeptide) pyrophosphoryl-undecaprenol N-acetylglucosamine transferase